MLPLLQNHNQELDKCCLLAFGRSGCILVAFSGNAWISLYGLLKLVKEQHFSL